MTKYKILDYIPAIVYWRMRGRITKMQRKCLLLLHSVLTFFTWILQQSNTEERTCFQRSRGKVINICNIYKHNWVNIYTQRKRGTTLYEPNAKKSHPWFRCYCKQVKPLKMVMKLPSKRLVHVMNERRKYPTRNKVIGRIIK